MVIITAKAMKCRRRVWRLSVTCVLTATAEVRRTRMNFTLLATPAEGLSGRFIRMDRKRYGVIPGVTDRDYYTNSFHIPVWYNISAFEKSGRRHPTMR
ncbi:MAG: anaerobic ribonucleoside-triphosphate reductase [Victivallis sp.]